MVKLLTFLNTLTDHLDNYVTIHEFSDFKRMRSRTRSFSSRCHLPLEDGTCLVSMNRDVIIEMVHYTVLLRGSCSLYSRGEITSVSE